MICGTLRRIHVVYAEYPRQFWIIVLGTFIDSLGGGIMFPFFTLYVTRKFSVGMTEVGTIFLLFSITSFVSSMAGGAMTDRFGRKRMIVLGLVASSASTLSIGLINSYDLFLAGALLVGLFANLGQPARQAMVADLLPEEQRTQGYGALRAAANLGVAIGPAIGGLLAAQSYLLLFVSDALLSLVTACMVGLALKETMPVRGAAGSDTSTARTSQGYGKVLQNRAFLLFMLAYALVAVIAIQMNSTLPVYLRDVHGVPEQGFGALMSLNAGMVVLFQFPITRRIKRFDPMIVMICGSLLYGLGTFLYGVVSVYSLFLVAMCIITVGEMVTAPVAQAQAAQFAPEDMRGRYMAVFSLSWAISSAIGPLLAGLAIDNLSPHWVWYGAGLLGMLSAFAFLGLRNGAARRAVKTVAGMVKTSP